MTTFEGKLSGKGMKFALVVGRFNEMISTRLYEGALDCLRRHDVARGGRRHRLGPGRLRDAAGRRASRRRAVATTP